MLRQVRTLSLSAGAERSGTESVRDRERRQRAECGETAAAELGAAPEQGLLSVEAPPRKGFLGCGDSPRSSGDSASPRSISDSASPRSIGDSASPRSIGDSDSPRSIGDSDSPGSSGDSASPRSSGDSDHARGIAALSPDLQGQGRTEPAVPS